MQRIAVSAVCFLIAMSCTGILPAVTPEFYAARTYGLGLSYAIAVADVNGDGIPDLIGGAGGATILLGNGDGTFRPGPPSGVPYIEIVWGIVPVDLNGDGITDLVLSGTSGVVVAFGKGDGTFGQALTYSVGETGGAVSGDFNGDGLPDIAATAGNGVWIFLAKGPGVFNPGVLVPVGTNDRIVAADFNQDGRLDLAVTTPTGAAVLFGNGNGTFNVSPIVAAGGGSQIATGDLNLDGYSDLALVISGSSYVYLYFGSPSTLTGPGFANLGPSLAIGIADMNGDGIPDLVSSDVAIAFGKGNGTFRPPAYYSVAGNYPYELALASLTSNKRVDIIVQEHATATVLLNAGHGRFENGIYSGAAGSSAGGPGAAADFNGDGKPDLAISTSGGIAILFGTGNSHNPFTAGPILSVPGGGIYTLLTADLNGDGIPDLLASVSGDGDGGPVYAYLGNGDGTFTLKSTTSIPGAGNIESSNIAIGDFNGDGKIDFASSGNYLALGLGDGTFQTPVPLAPGYGMTNLAAADINGDGFSDLVLTNVFGDDIYVLINNKQGGFRLAQTIEIDGGGSLASFADMNNDGKLDLIITGGYGSDYIYLNSGKNQFTLKSEVGGGNVGVMIADLNGDGILDISTPGEGGPTIYIGNGDGTYQNGFSLASTAVYFLAENLQGQPASAGLPDIVAAGGGVTILLNLTK